MEINISTNQLLPALQVLPQADKLHIIQFLVLLLAQEEGIYDTSNAADTLFNMLMEDKLNCHKIHNNQINHSSKPL